MLQKERRGCEPIRHWTAKITTFLGPSSVFTCPFEATFASTCLAKVGYCEITREFRIVEEIFLEASTVTSGLEQDLPSTS